MQASLEYPKFSVRFRLTRCHVSTNADAWKWVDSGLECRDII